MRTLIFITLTVVLTGCGAPTFIGVFDSTNGVGGSGGTGGDGTISSLSGYQAFLDGVYTWTNQQGCKNCHANLQTPLFDSPDPYTAYAHAKTRVDFHDPTHSIFVAHAGDGHCGLPLCSNSANSAVMEVLLIAWAEAENTDGPAAPTYLTATRPIPANLKLMTDPGVHTFVRFPLSGLTPAIAQFTNSILEVEVTWTSSARNEYHIEKPRIAGLPNGYAIATGIHVFVKKASESGIGVEDTYQGDWWNGITLRTRQRTVVLPAVLPTIPFTDGSNNTAVQAAPLRILNSANQYVYPTALNIQVHSSSDVMTIGFDNLQYSTILPP